MSRFHKLRPRTRLHLGFPISEPRLSRLRYRRTNCQRSRVLRMSQRVAQPCPRRDQKVSSYPRLTGLRQCPSSRVCECLRPRRAVRASRHPLSQEAQRSHSLSVLPSLPSKRRRSDRLPPLRSLSRFPSTQRRFPSGQRQPLAKAVRPSPRQPRLLFGPSQLSAWTSASVGRSVSRNTSTRCCATSPSSSA